MLYCVLYGVCIAYCMLYCVLYGVRIAYCMLYCVLYGVCIAYCMLYCVLYGVCTAYCMLYLHEFHPFVLILATQQRSLNVTGGELFAESSLLPAWLLP
jgi:hypothetical protein